ncbi:MAG: hypothetical protein EA422_14040 [Gemmatimonadales bacterium]|nr:MAG: hypothetical protein EA422_14040 [Gemmatimonadales bacterium]
MGFRGWSHRGYLAPPQTGEAIIMSDSRVYSHLAPGLAALLLLPAGTLAQSSGLGPEGVAQLDHAPSWEVWESVQEASARISITGSVEADGEGEAFWLQRQDPISGRDGFIIVLSLRDGGDLRMLEFGFLSGDRPGAGTHTILSLDEMMEISEGGGALTGVMASYLSGDFASWQEVSELVADPNADFQLFQTRMTGSGMGVSGEVQIQAGSGDTLEGQVSAAMVLITEFGDELPFQVEATFRASAAP